MSLIQRLLRAGDRPFPFATSLTSCVIPSRIDKFFRLEKAWTAMRQSVSASRRLNLFDSARSTAHLKVRASTIATSKVPQICYDAEAMIQPWLSLKTTPIPQWSFPNFAASTLRFKFPICGAFHELEAGGATRVKLHQFIARYSVSKFKIFSIASSGEIHWWLKIHSFLLFQMP